MEERWPACRTGIGGPVTLRAADPAMRALEGEPGKRMIEGRQIYPGTRDVTVGALSAHGLELALVRIGVARPATQRIKPVAYRCRRFGAAWRRPQLVAIVARRGLMTAIQGEASVLMPGHGKLCRTKAVHGVTALATVAEPRVSELPGVRVTVAILALSGL